MLAIAGCSEDNTHPKVSPVDEPSADAVTILATIDAIPSATGDGEAYAPLWQEGDQIIVGYKGMSYVYETYDAGNGVEFHPVALSLPADARGEVTAYFKAVDGVFAVGADQTGATLPMYAYAADAAPAQGSLGLHFKPLASVLSLTIGEEASKTISKITLEPVDPDGVEGHLAVSEAVVDPRTGAVTVGEDAAVSDILTMEIGEMSLVQAQTVNFLIASGTKVDGGLKATISCTDGSVFVKNLFEGQEVAFAGNCVGAATELFFRLRIATYEDMVNFAQECADDNGGAIVDLQADIDMRNVPWTPVENFTGTFNGNGHRIYNINVSADGRYAGFFAYAKGAISDVVFGSKDGTSYDGTSRIELKYSADTDTWCYAGIVAQSNNTLTGVTSFVPVTVTADSRCKSRTGGIVGSLYNGKMSGCRNYGAVSNVATAGVASYVAGIAGIVDGSGDAAGAITLDGCHNHGPVMTSLGLGNAVAGITASVMKTAVNTTISNCTNAGEIRFDNAGTSAAHRIGGIVAYIVDSCPTLVIDNCTNKGTVVSNMNGNCFIGGIAGVNYAAAIRDCTNEAEVKFVQANAAGAGYLCIGGIAGQTYSGAKVTGCANRAAVSSDKLQVTRIGGIVGTHNASTIDDCSNSGDITLAYTATANNWEAAGGIVGFYDGGDQRLHEQRQGLGDGKFQQRQYRRRRHRGHHQVGQCDQQHQRRCGLDAQCPGGQELLCGRHRRLRLQYQGQVGRHGQCQQRCGTGHRRGHFGAAGGRGHHRAQRRGRRVRMQEFRRGGMCAACGGARGLEQEKRGGQRRRRFGERHGTHRDELCGTGGWLPGRGLVVGHHLRGEIARQIINYLTERNLL